MLADILHREILPRVEKPSRYLGTELNTVRKDPACVDFRICLAFPDSYDIGLGNLGLQILYHILNRQPRVWAERVYAPGLDMEAQLRRRGLPLFSLESRTPLDQFDAIGFTLQWELTYTNILNLIDMAGLPVLARERDERHPVLLAGGPCVFNPEPLCDFMDAFVMGDGEEVVLEVAEALVDAKGSSRGAQLERLARIPGVYVPALYPMRPTEDGSLIMPEDARPIVKRTVAALDTAAFPTEYIVPYTRQIHDRVSLEVLRGCTQGCRFCQAGMVTRPVRERTLPDLDRLMEETMRKTGYEEISLVSLSTCDYSQVKTLVQQSVARAVPEGVSVSLPSLRLDSFSVEMADMISVMGKSGLTFAPEAATNRMRAVINKWIPDEDLLEMAREAYERGWDHIKLYFMIGLPTEREEDVLAIADLANRVLGVGKSVLRKARLNLGVSTFCPKPHTPFQWDRQILLEETEAKQDLLMRGLRPGIKFGRHDARESFLEGVLSRGDRRTGRLLLEAHRLGCRFDGWREHLDWSKWQEAFRRWGFDAADQLRARRLSEPLPWDHIDSLVPKSWLIADYWRSRGLVWQGDCRHARCNQCGVIDREKDLCVSMLRKSHKDRKAENARQFPRIERPPEPPPAARLRLRFARRGLVRLLSHLEMMNMFLRAIRRARLPVSYTQGFNPGPRVAFSCALPVGLETEGDYMDIHLRAAVPPEEARERLNAVLPEGFEILRAAEVPLRSPALMAVVAGERYLARIEGPVRRSPEALADAAPEVEGEGGGSAAGAAACPSKDLLDRILGAARCMKSRDALWVDKESKRGRVRRENLLGSIEEIRAIRESSGRLAVEMLLLKQGETKASARQVLTALAPEIAFEDWRIVKLETYVRTPSGLAGPIDAPDALRPGGPGPAIVPDSSGTESHPAQPASLSAR
ncbi:MAG: TIGR03960 family B12-binding radical SAM protein [Planctomycetes bacterium]|nr:TIGR03960 family B12-binding radical SAM protein [Planctomycetota bacterium]